jgi:Protein of unknown function (DUF2795)/Ion channel
MNLRAIKWNGRWIVVIEPVEQFAEHPAEQDPGDEPSRRGRNFLIAFLVVTPIVFLVAYGANGLVLSVLTAPLAGLFIAAISAFLLAARLTTVLLTGLTAGLFLGLMPLLTSPFMNSYMFVYDGYRSLVDGIVYWILSITHDSTIVINLARFCVVGFPYGIGWGLFLGAFGALTAALASTENEYAQMRTGRQGGLRLRYDGQLSLLISIIVGFSIIQLIAPLRISTFLGTILGIFASGYISSSIGNWLGIRLRGVLGPGLRRFSDSVIPLMHEIWQPLIGFALGYMAIVLLFAACFATAHRLDSNPTGQFTKSRPEVEQFLQGLDYPISKEEIVKQAEEQVADGNLHSTLERLPNRKYETPTAVNQVVDELTKLEFQHFLYFSIMTITTLGYSDLEPASPWTQSLAAIEGILAFVWTAIILSLLILHLEIQHSRQGNQQSSRDEFTTTPQQQASRNAALEAERGTPLSERQLLEVERQLSEWIIRGRESR